jgi:hypothetical protein
MKFRSFFTPLAAVAGLIFIVGMVLLGGLLLRNPLSLINEGGLPSATALQFVPKQSALVGSLLTRPDRLADVWEYLTAPNLRQGTRQDLEQIEQTLLAGTGLSYEEDILPWLGEEITVALVSPDMDQDSANGQDPGLFVVLACKDSQAAKAMLELFWQNRAIAGDVLTFEEFSGNRLIYSAPRVESARFPGTNFLGLTFDRLATTVIANQFILVANHPEVLRQALNAAQSSDNNLAADRRYRSALRSLPETRVGLLAFRMPAIAQVLGNQSPMSEPYDSFKSPLGDPGDALDWGLISFGLDREGLLGDIALTATPGYRLSPRQAVFSALPTVASYLPDRTAMAAVGLDLKTLWASAQPLWQLYGAQLRPEQFIDNDLARLITADLGRELLNTLDQPFALGVDPDDGSNWLLAVKQHATFEDALRHLGTAAQAEGIGLSPLEIKGYSTTALTRLMLKPMVDTSDRRDAQVMAQVLGLYSQADDVDIVASSPSLMKAALEHRETSSTPPDWTQDLSRFQKPNEGYIHIDWPKLQSGLRQQVPKFRLLETAARPLLKHLKQITLTSYGRTSELQTGRIFFQLSNQ